MKKLSHTKMQSLKLVSIGCALLLSACGVEDQAELGMEDYALSTAQKVGYKVDLSQSQVSFNSFFDPWVPEYREEYNLSLPESPAVQTGDLLYVKIALAQKDIFKLRSSAGLDTDMNIILEIGDAETPCSSNANPGPGGVLLPPVYNLKSAINIAQSVDVDGFLYTKYCQAGPILPQKLMFFGSYSLDSILVDNTRSAGFAGIEFKVEIPANVPAGTVFEPGNLSISFTSEQLTSAPARTPFFMKF